MFTLVSCVSHSEICGNMWNVVNWWVTGGGSYIASDLTGEIFGIPEFLNLGGRDRAGVCKFWIWMFF